MTCLFPIPMRVASGFSLVFVLISSLFSGCGSTTTDTTDNTREGGSGGTPDSDAMVASDGVISDAGSNGIEPQDGAARDDTAPGHDGPPVGRPPAPPVLIKPTPNTRVFSVVDVEGSAEPGAALTVRLIKGVSEVGIGRTQVDEGGNFVLAVEYRGLAHSDALVVEVQVRNSFGSAMRRVDVEHWAPSTLSVSVSQTTGPSTGTDVYVRLYRMGEAELPRWLDEQRFAIGPGQYPSGRLVDFRVPPGSYVVRAFRDTSGPIEPVPDGHPTLGGDPQSRGISAIVTGQSGRVEVELLPPASPRSRYTRLNAYTFNQSALPLPPSMREGNRRKVGQGWCGGFFLDLNARLEGAGDTLSPPFVSLPDLRSVELRDDGACGPETRDNRGHSFDNERGDGDFHYGIPDPGPAQIGTYTFAFRDRISDTIHVETDELTAIRRLSLLREPIFPTSTDTSRDTRPTLTWQPVPNAAAYDVHIRSNTGWNNQLDTGRFVTSPAYRPALNLADDTCYSVNISALDANPLTADVDAVALGMTTAFCVDVAGDSTIIVSGAIRNNTQQLAPYVVHVRASDESMAIARVPANATSYRVALLAGSRADAGSFEAFLDRAGTGFPGSHENEGYSVRSDKHDFTRNATLDLTFNPRLIALAPTWFARVPAQPRLQWEDYRVTAGAAGPSGNFSYVVWVGNEGGDNGFPPSAFVLPRDLQAWDYANPPPLNQSLDLVSLAWCIGAGGTFATDAGGNPQCMNVSLPLVTSVRRFDPDVLYIWAVVVVECDFSELRHPASAANNPFLGCLIESLSKNRVFASSASLPFTVAP